MSNDSPRPKTFKRMLLLGTMATALVAAPLTVETGSLDLVWKTALAKKGGNGNGHGGERGERGGRDHSDRGNGHGHGTDAKDHPGGRKHTDGHGRGEGRGGYHDFGEFVDHLRSGKAFGAERRDERVAKAKDRYREALDGRRKRDRQANGGANFDGDAHRAAHRFSPHATKDLIERGWRGRQSLDGFKTHGQRVRTMVEIAKRRGYGARVGALQGNFGTPFENGIAELRAELEVANAALDTDPPGPEVAARVEVLEAELAAAIAAAKPGNGPSDDWATADLDVNDDDIVDQRDLAALEAQADDQEPTPDEVSEDEISESESEEAPAS